MVKLGHRETLKLYFTIVWIFETFRLRTVYAKLGPLLDYNEFKARNRKPNYKRNEFYNKLIRLMRLIFNLPSIPTIKQTFKCIVDIYVLSSHKSNT